ncbi:MAG: hypothetical protein M3041_05970 [Acidobacteriota bacterium]|nr:hypothetical protein [Acidobacteriota bacterium]
MKSTHKRLLFGVLLLALALPLAGQTPSRLRLNGTGSAEGVDLNANGKFDQLVVNFGIDADLGAFYQYSVSLTDRNGRNLGSYTDVVFLSAGSNTVTATFDGVPIGANGVDGPYFLSNLNMFDFFGQGISLVAPIAFTTQAFRASAFEGFSGVIDTTPPTVVVRVTPSVLWPPNHKMVEITVHVMATDDIDPNPVVSYSGTVSNQLASNSGENQHGDNQGGYEGGNTSPDISFQHGKLFLRAERTGRGNQDRVYTITYSARDAAGNIGIGTATVTVPHDHGH